MALLNNALKFKGNLLRQTFFMTEQCQTFRYSPRLFCCNLLVPQSCAKVYDSVTGEHVISTQNSSKNVITDTNRRHNQARLMAMGVQAGLKWRKYVP